MGSYGKREKSVKILYGGLPGISPFAFFFLKKMRDDPVFWDGPVFREKRCMVVSAKLAFAYKLKNSSFRKRSNNAVCCRYQFS